jgi:pimeloyl-ACP methyl ester carboxylesterase
MKRVIVYVPGLGDHRSRGQRAVVWLWRLYGVRTETVRMEWRVDVPFEAKLARLLVRIDDLHAAGYSVSLVGVSAGASAAINAFARRQDVVAQVVCICGKLRNPETISSRTYRQNPAFAESLQLLPGSLLGIADDTRHRILSIRPLADRLVPPEDTVIPGAAEKVIPTSGHVFSIAACITLYSFAVVRFLKR